MESFDSLSFSLFLSLSLFKRLCCPSLIADPLDCIHCLHWTDLCESLLECPCVEVRKWTFQMSLSLFPQHRPECLARLYWMECEIGRMWLYTRSFVGCYFQDLFKTAHNILVSFPSSFFSQRFVRVQVVYPNSRTDTATTWKKSHFILSKRPNFKMIDNLSIAF